MSSTLDDFTTTLGQGYDFLPLIPIGQAKYDDTITDITVGIPVRMLNRHGLIAGATGTGKTKTVQLFVEWCAQAGIPTLVMDMKGDISWLTMSGDATHTKILERYELLGQSYHARGFDAEFMSLTGTNGYQRKTTIIELWPIMLAQMLELNDTQTSALGAIFHYADTEQLPLLDLADLQTLLKYLSDKSVNEIFGQTYGHIAPATLSVILRKTITLEQQWGKTIFGEPSFELSDMIKTTPTGEWLITIMKCEDIQSKPQLFCTAVLGIVGELYNTLPEVGDSDKPKLVMIIDEAHLLFQLASRDLLRQIETMIKLIRSKGVGIYFCTQLPDDIPSPILSQLGSKIQHALRSFTARDRKALKTAVENYPITAYYNTEELITSLWVGEILFTTLNPKGIPTPLAHVFNLTPASRMDTITESELSSFLRGSLLRDKYNTTIDSESAHEILSKRMQQKSNTDKKSPDSTTNILWSVGKKVATSVVKEMGNMVIRNILGQMGIKVRSNKTFF